MRVPINWLKEYTEIPKDLTKLTDALTLAGHMLDKKEVFGKEIVIDLELRGNRADCYSIVGIAREACAIFGSKLKKLEIINLKKTTNLSGFKLKADSRFVKRAAFVEITNVKIHKSPDWLTNRLSAYGIESVNNIVDLTNYVMIELGEPMHAFDLDKIGKNLSIRLAETGEKINTFAGSTISLTKDDLVWAKEGHILSVAGAIGEKYHSISESTKNVLLEAANYDRANIRRSVHRHNLFTEAGTRHEKELDPNLVEAGIGRFLYFIKKFKWGSFKPLMLDYYPQKSVKINANFNIGRFEEHSGVQIPEKRILSIFKNLNFEVINKKKEYIELAIPTYRTDILLEEDLFEEILRIEGYDKIPPKTLSLEIPKNQTLEFIRQENFLRESVVSVGFNEAITLPFVRDENKYDNISPENYSFKTASLVNPPSPDTRDLRQSLYTNLKNNLQKVINERGELAMLFEIGKIYYKFKNTYSEKRRLGIIYWDKNGGNFSNFKGLLLAIFAKSNLPEPAFTTAIKNFKLTNTYDLAVEKRVLGFGGQEKEIYYAEIDLEQILDLPQRYQVSLWPKYPPQIEDITLTLPEKTKLGEVLLSIKKTNQLIQNVELKDVYQKSYTFRVWYQSEEKTLESAEVSNVRTKIIQNLTTTFGATIK